MTEQSQTRNAMISLGFAVFGLLLCLIPLKVDVDKGGGAAVLFGLVTLITALIMAKVFFNRAALLARMFSGQSRLAEWPNPEYPSNPTVLSTEGVVFEGELYSFGDFTGYLVSVECDEKTHEHLIMTVSRPHKTHRHNVELRIPFPPDQAERAKILANALRGKYQKSE